MLELINKCLWGVASALIIMSSIDFSFSFNFIQFNFKEMFKNLFKENDKKIGITPIQSFLMTLGSRIGVGSIAGVSLALYLGGPGSVFWMWISAFLSAANTFSETVLGMVFRKKDLSTYKGGPSYYIKDGLGLKKLGGIYAILILISYVFGFVGIQGNTITKSLIRISNISPIIIGIILVITTASIIYGGLKKIAAFSEKLVPLMTVLYILVALIVTIRNIRLLPNIFITIFTSAFKERSIYGGFLGTLIIGIQRGIFSNEAGLGTGSITSSTVAINDHVGQGYIQILGIYITTLLICTSTAIIVMTSNYQSIIVNDINGIELTQYAFNYHFGTIGNIILVISILLFSFTTILTGYYDGESSLKYFFNNPKPGYLNLLKMVSLIVLFIGCIVSSKMLWIIVDMFMALLAIINIYALIKLKPVVKEELRYYNAKKYDKISTR